jgi:putative component of membrane protein insertase Oxa1/YidC/SpoIIIJ protein YidD
MKILVKITFLAVIILSSVCVGKAQGVEKDLDLIFNKSFEKNEEPYRPNFMFVTKHKLIRYNPVSLTFGGLMYFYQAVLSPQISAECPYEISCSNFGKACISKYGIIKGIALASGRIMRCTKIAAADIHPLYIDEKGMIIDNPEDYKLK